MKNEEGLELSEKEEMSGLSGFDRTSEKCLPGNFETNERFERFCGLHIERFKWEPLVLQDILKEIKDKNEKRKAFVELYCSGSVVIFDSHYLITKREDYQGQFIGIDWAKTGEDKTTTHCTEEPKDYGKGIEEIVEMQKKFQTWGFLSRFEKTELSPYKLIKDESDE